MTLKNVGGIAMNLYDFSNINRIFDRYESQIPGIKIVDGSKSFRAVDEFKSDLENYNALGGHEEVERVLIHDGCLVDIQLKNTQTPVIYYFIDKFDGVGDTIGEFKRVCDELDIRVQELN